MNYEYLHMQVEQLLFCRLFKCCSFMPDYKVLYIIAAIYITTLVMEIDISTLDWIKFSSVILTATNNQYSY